jgi:tRNA U54 and U55 pseudouridine synthase Pus10
MTGIKGGTAMKFDDFMKEIGEDTIETETIRQLAHMVSDIVKRRKMLGLTQDSMWVLTPFKAWKDYADDK